LTNPYADAADTMRLCIMARADAHRRLVISICALAGVTMVASVATGSTMPLWALGGIPALVLNHFRRDRQAVHHWRTCTLNAWASGSLRLDVLATMLAQVPALPADTVRGMVDCLPKWPGDQVGPAARQALLNAQASIGRLAEWDLGARTLVALVGAGLVGVAGASRAWPVLLCTAALPISWAGWRRWHRSANVRAARTLADDLDSCASEVDAATREQWMAGLDLQDEPARLAFQTLMRSGLAATGR
jgi:hypothetical protein